MKKNVVNAWEFSDIKSLVAGNVKKAKYLGEINSLQDLLTIATRYKLVSYTQGDYPNHNNITFAQVKSLLKENPWITVLREIHIWEPLQYFYYRHIFPLGLAKPKVVEIAKILRGGPGAFGDINNFIYLNENDGVAFVKIIGLHVKSEQPQLYVAISRVLYRYPKSTMIAKDTILVELKYIYVE